MSKVLIISPHNDDALIGCFLYLTNRIKFFEISFNKSTNYIFFGSEELEGERYEEAMRFAKDFNLIVADLEFNLITSEFDLVLAPSPESSHYYHKYFAYKSLDIKAKHRIFYSTDMTEWWVRPLPNDLRELKKDLLDKYFVYEKDLWRYDGRYYIFEGYVSPMWCENGYKCEA